MSTDVSSGPAERKRLASTAGAVPLPRHVPAASGVIRVLLVDDQVLIRQGVRAVLYQERNPDVEIVGEAGSGEEALAKVAALHPDVVLMDIMMPGGDGITATRKIKQQHPGVQVLILTAHGDQDLFQKAAEAGASGYVLKDITPPNLVRAIRTVHDGGTMLSPTIAKQIVDYLFATRHDMHLATTGRIYGLTQREVDVLVGLVQGLSDKEIAKKLFLSESTVKTHLRAIYRRFQVKNRAQAVAFAVEKKLLGISQAG
jgi:DNA-binding NarL/FixJ family response regulator